MAGEADRTDESPLSRPALDLVQDTSPPPATRDLRALALETVQEFGSASLAFVAWELEVTEEQLAEVWTGAKSDGLIEPAGICLETGERLYRLTHLGREARR